MADMFFGVLTVFVLKANIDTTDSGIVWFCLSFSGNLIRIYLVSLHIYLLPLIILLAESGGKLSGG